MPDDAKAPPVTIPSTITLNVNVTWTGLDVMLTHLAAIAQELRRVEAKIDALGVTSTQLAALTAQVQEHAASMKAALDAANKPAA
jgi:uncharacterized protein with PhoU and TrkA domain